jgi:hypothetical protein
MERHLEGSNRAEPFPADQDDESTCEGGFVNSSQVYKLNLLPSPEQRQKDIEIYDGIMDPTYNLNIIKIY